MNKINAKLLPAKADKFPGGIERDIKAIPENHSIGAEIPAGKVIRVKEVFCEDLQLQVVESFAVSLNRSLRV